MAFDRKALMSELRRLGFKRTYADKYGYAIYTVTCGRRTLSAQLYSDRARVSHFLNNHMSTVPTPFATPEELRAAVKRELTRTDHKPIRMALGME